MRASSSAAGDGAEGAGALSLADGHAWWCPANNPSCGISILPPVSNGWAEASTDPVGGSVGIRDGAFHTDQGPVPSRCVDFMGSQLCFPVTEWGLGTSEAVIRQAFVIGSDGTLAPGDPVQIQANFLLEGEFTDDLLLADGVSPASRVGAVLLLWEYDPADPIALLEGTDYTAYSTAMDILGTPELAALLEDHILVEIDSAEEDADLPFSIPDSRVITLQVGDVVVLDLAMVGQVVLGNDDQWTESWADFGNTASAGLVPLTAGANLVPIPEPGTLLSLAAGLSGLAFLGRKR